MTGLQWVTISLTRRPFPTLLAILCLSTACLATDLFLTFVRGQTSFIDHLDSDYDLVVGPKSSGTEILLGALGEKEMAEETIPYALVRYLGRRAHLRHHISLYSLGDFRGCPVVGTDENYWNRPEGFVSPQLIRGNLPSASHEVVLGSLAAQRLGLVPGDSLKIEIHPSLSVDDNLLWKADWNVVGIAEDPRGFDNDSIIVPIEGAWEYYRWCLSHGLGEEHKNQEAITYLLISADPEELGFVETKIHEGSTVQVVNIPEELEFLKLLVSGARRGSDLLCFLVLLLASLGVAVRVNGRFDSLKQELGLLRALGYTRNEIVQWLVMEGLISTVAAVFIAIVLEAILYSFWRHLLVTSWTHSIPAWPAI